MHSVKKKFSFQFVLDELMPVRPIIKRMFGFTYVYLDEKLFLALRQSDKQPNTNGVWIFTASEHLESLRLEFPDLPRQNFWKSGKNGWVILTSRLENFEEFVYKACELILCGDQRLGRVTRGSWKVQPDNVKSAPHETSSKIL